ncbi:hypothetical protein JAAARDRAFT_410464 [Jaapia argillacea MUCL 33604]|uniref:Cytochrome P450 n=1 Tax=Jaapia argillacea MUCL 33604 TaxID=933084 RepID=A0A067PJR3_9AGAM|nr:hypothetical protein JAAARDRAFT_410464 [Jaapia argillacea MUCL 33604]
MLVYEWRTHPHSSLLPSITMVLTLVDALLGLAGIFLLRQLFARKQHTPLPPGPKGLPLVGNVLDMPKKQPWITFNKWGEQFGDVFYLNLLGQPMIILNSAKQAINILDKKSLIYSDRPSLEMCNMTGWNKGLGLLPYGDDFRETRRMFHGVMGSKASMEKLMPIVEEETKKHLIRVLEDPDEVAQSIRKTAGAIILLMAYGYRVKEGNDPLVDLVDAGMEEFAIMTSPGAFLVDVFPILRHVPSWFPGAGFKRLVVEWKKTCADLVALPFQYVEEQMAAGSATPSFSSAQLEKGNFTEEEYVVVRWAAASMYAGAADTTVSALYSFILALTLFPEVRKRAQDEIDKVVGNDRLPSLDDRDDLPYLEALVKEVFRWNPVAPLGLPHRVTQDDIHENHFIPKGSIVIANIWAILHDPQTYANPMEFNPERFLPSPGREAEVDPRTFCFGFGRRICPGLNLADASVFLSCAMTLAVFNVSKALDAHGNPIDPIVEYTDSTVSHPKPFKCSITPRSTKAQSLIHSVD